MTRAIICDRCGTVFTDDTEMHEMDATPINAIDEEKITFHLCTECYLSFIAWLEEPEKGVDGNG